MEALQKGLSQPLAKAEGRKAVIRKPLATEGGVAD